MKLSELIQNLNLSVRSAKENLEREVTGGYASDLLSDVLAHSREGDLWITLQTHQNIAAVASMKDLAGIILVNGREPEQETIEKAEAEILAKDFDEVDATTVKGFIDIVTKEE